MGSLRPIRIVEPVEGFTANFGRDREREEWGFGTEIALALANCKIKCS